MGKGGERVTCGGRSRQSACGRARGSAITGEARRGERRRMGAYGGAGCNTGEFVANSGDCECGRGRSGSLFVHAFKVLDRGPPSFVETK